MKRLLIGISAAASLIATGALAADLPVKAPVYTKAPVYVDPGYDWTGFYVGGNVGYSWGSSNSTLTLTDPGTGATLNSAGNKFNMDGVIGGGQIGYNWQRDRWVFGLEADFQGSGQKGSGNAVCAGGTATVLNSACALGHIGDTTPFNVPAFPVNDGLYQALDWFGTFRGRIGSTAITPTFLAYVTGGLAYGSVNTTNIVSGVNITGPQGVNGSTLTSFLASSSSSSLRVGWTVGAGVEGVISGNWTARLEYLYIDLGNVSGSYATTLIAPSGALATGSYSSHITDNILRVGVNYKFTGPVVAKY